MIRAGLAALLLLAAPAARAQDAAQDAGARIQRLEDEAAIGRLILDYGRHLDALDFAAFAALFAEDGQWFGGGAPAVGPAEIEARMVAGFGPDSGAVWTTDFHIVGNSQIDVDGDRASAVSRWIFVSPDGEDAPTPVLSGRYVDEFVRTGAGWRFASRRLVNDLADTRFPAIRQDWDQARD